LRVLGQLWVAFGAIFGIVLAIVLFLFQSRLDLLSLSAKFVTINTAFAVLISLGATAMILLAFVLVTSFLSKVWRGFLVRITLHTLDQAVGRYSEPVQATGIGARRGDIVVRLAVGSNEGVREGDNFLVLNTTTRDEWGVLEVMEAEETSCVCRVSDTINVDFWTGLEERMQRDPSPPMGITFSKEVPEGFSGFAQSLIRGWGG